MHDPGKDSHAPAAIRKQSILDNTGEVDAGCSGMNEEQLAEAKQYGRLELLCTLADKVLDVIYLALVAAFVAVPLDRWLARHLPGETTRLAAMFLIVTAGHLVISFPLSWYAGYSLEHQFGLSRQSFAGWLWRYTKRNALALSFGALLIIGLYWTIWTAGSWWWLLAAVLFFLVSIVVAQLVPVVVLPLFYKIERLSHPELETRMGRLAQGTGLSIEGVYRLEMSAETSKANAMLAGLGRTRRVLLGDTLLDRFADDEIEVILAHEIGHHVYGHIRKMILAGFVYSIAGFWICDRIIMAWVTRVEPGATYARLPVWTLPVLMLVLTLLSLVLEPLQNAISRRYERQCDRYALARTGHRQAYVSAFQKLAVLNKNDPDPHPLEVFWFHSHPSIAERLALAQDSS